MGRTGRHRKKITHKFRRLDHNPDLIALNLWLSNNGIEWNKKLGYADFEDVGRGVVTNQTLNPGEILVNLPLTLTINITTVLLDDEFLEMFTDCAQQPCVSLQAMLAFYLVYLRHKTPQSKWHVYLESLPTEYTVPYFLSDDIKINLENSIRNIIKKQEEAVMTSFEIFTNILSTGTNGGSKTLKEKCTRHDYEWAYFTVNTRCVYMDLSEVIDLKTVNNPVLRLIRDNLTIALCPYLDMINHSSNVKTQTKLKVTAVSTPLKCLEENELSHIRFCLYTMNSVKSYNEVYICYGDSHNLKLVTEYGFFLPSNQLDAVHFDFENVKSHLSSRNMKLSQEQSRFIQTHNLNNGLYIDSSGLSFNFYALLTVLKFYGSNSNDMSRIIYTADETRLSNSNLNELIIPLVNDRIVEIEQCISKLVNVMVNVQSSVNLKNCVNLMEHYVSLLRSLNE